MSQPSLGLPGVLDVDRSARDAQDRYYTPDGVVDQIGEVFGLELDALGLGSPMGGALSAARRGVLEPSAGGGALLRGLHRVMLAHDFVLPDLVDACDLDPRPERPLGFSGVGWHRGDFRDRPWGGGRYGLAITNPPFAFAEEQIRLCREVADYTLALVRLTFLESAKRAAWLIEDMPHVYVLAERPRFIGLSGTDSVTCAWMLWTPERRGHATVRVLP